jgi:hypothetical protein
VLFTMLPSYYTIVDEAQFAIEQRDRELERRRLIHEARRQASKDGLPSRTPLPASAWRAVAALVRQTARLGRRSPAATSGQANAGLKA